MGKHHLWKNPGYLGELWTHRVHNENTNRWRREQQASVKKTVNKQHHKPRRQTLSLAKLSTICVNRVRLFWVWSDHVFWQRKAGVACRWRSHTVSGKLSLRGWSWEIWLSADLLWGIFKRTFVEAEQLAQCWLTCIKNQMLCCSQNKLCNQETHVSKPNSEAE